MVQKLGSDPGSNSTLNLGRPFPPVYNKCNDQEWDWRQENRHHLNILLFVLNLTIPFSFSCFDFGEHASRPPSIIGAREIARCRRRGTCTWLALVTYGERATSETSHERVITSQSLTIATHQLLLATRVLARRS